MGIAMYTRVPFNPHQIKQSFLENISRTQRHKYICLFYSLLSTAIYGTRVCLCSGSDKSGREAGSVNPATCAPGGGGRVPRETARGAVSWDHLPEMHRPRQGGAGAARSSGRGHGRGHGLRAHAGAWALRTGGGGARLSLVAERSRWQQRQPEGLGDTQGPGPGLRFKETGFRGGKNPPGNVPVGRTPLLGVV